MLDDRQDAYPTVELVSDLLLQVLYGLQLCDRQPQHCVGLLSETSLGARHVWNHDCHVPSQAHRDQKLNCCRHDRSKLRVDCEPEPSTWFVADC